ncbi:hypothetical protein ACFQL1_04640 [Halomicroarcula sp. GCM10025709]|uniref:hypothetical protein n=1 Tax=Haloarcula TaxID=2237 RepID=UPI0024C2BDAB|nr:hypothetical protein [Halomicroarcula sp. YJ-61-S]
MRRIYESGAVSRDDDDSFAPNERDEVKPQAMRSVPGKRLSSLLVPEWLCYRALSVGVETPKPDFAVGEAVPIRVTLRNALPIPVTLTTESPLLWTWHVDGVPEASHVERTIADEPGEFAFDRGERKTFTRTWQQSVRVSEDEWEPAGPGEYTIGARLNVPDAAGKGVAAETTIRIEDRATDSFTSGPPHS